MISLRPYQDKIIEDMRSAMRRTRRVVLQLATGGGKTVITSFMVKSIVERGKTVYFCVHRRELLKQVSNTFKQIGIPHGFIAAGQPYDPGYLCHIVSIDTLKNRLEDLMPPDVLIVDEGHHAGSAGWSRVLAWATNFKIALTATPWRLDGKGMKAHFDKMVLGPSMAWLMENGYLSKYRIFAPSMIDLSGVRKSHGDFITEDLEKLLNDKVLFGDVVANYIKHADGLRTIVFCPTVKISVNLVEQFKDMGVPAAHLDALSDKEERADAIDDFADGRIRVLSNVGLFTEGFDMSSMVGREVPIEAIIVYRPTMSLSLHLQMLGRALRPKEKPAIILDHGGNCLRHGLPDDDYEWTLEDRPKRKKGDKEGEAPSKRCPECFHIMPPRLLSCPECGFIFQAPERETVEAEMVEVDKEAFKKRQKAEVGQARSLEQLQRIATERGYKPGWAYHVWSSRQKTNRQY